MFQLFIFFRAFGGVVWGLGRVFRQKVCVAAWRGDCKCTHHCCGFVEMETSGCFKLALIAWCLGCLAEAIARWLTGRCI